VDAFRLPVTSAPTSFTVTLTTKSPVSGPRQPVHHHRRIALLLVRFFRQFQLVSVQEVAALIRELPDKSCCLDPLPTAQLKAVADVVSPFLTELFNRSLSTGSVPESSR